MDTDSFYQNLPLLDSFFEASDIQNYHPLPEDWYIGLTDIKNSTDAIQSNDYKKVNILGVSPIAGLLDDKTKQRLPFSFGGDGCIICLPPSLHEKAQHVFASSQQIGKHEFGLHLRAAIIPAAYIREKGYQLKIARFGVTKFYNQAFFVGDGFDYAENLLKSEKQTSYHLSPQSHTATADFSGLECRWKEVSPPEKSVISLLVASNPSHKSPEQVYDEVLRKLKSFFDFDDKTNPVITSNLKMNFSLFKLMGELKSRTFGKSWLKRWFYFIKMELQILLGKIFMLFDYASSVTDWSLYKSDLSMQSDNRKFDNKLRLVISGTKEQQDKLEHFLEEMFQQSKLAYGIHVADSVTITCMVFQYHRDHIHFVDGSDGGYAEAAKGLKQRLEKLRERDCD